MSLENKVILISGGSRGIGRSIVLEATARGAKVVFCGRQLDRLQNIKNEIKELGRSEQILAVEADISQEQDVKRLFAEALTRFGHVDIVVNNAIIIRDYLLTFMPNEAWLDVLAVNLSGAFLISKYAVKTFLEKNIAGKLLSLGSIVQNGSPSAVAYSTSKGGLVGLTQNIAHDFAAHKISASLLSFGYVETELMSAYPEVVMNIIKELCPKKRAASENEAAEVLLSFAALPQKIINGQCIYVSGGLQDIPAVSFSKVSLLAEVRKGS